MNKKNIIIIHTHDSGRLLSPYGVDVPTPNIQGFAEEGTLFRNCFCASPTCSPSRASMLTGMYPHQNGMIGLAHRGFSIKDYDFHMARYFHRKGFHSVLCGIQHEAKAAEDIGYDEIIGVQDYDMGSPYSDMTQFDYNNTEAVCSYLSKYDSDEPLFLSIGFYNTHLAFPPDDGTVNPDYLAVPNGLFDCKEIREDMVGYHRSIRIVDTCFGRIYDTLRNYGYLDNSVIVFNRSWPSIS